MGAFGLILVALVALFGMLIILSIIRGFALSYLWLWFMTPFGLPEIGVAWAIGISMIVTFLTYEGAYQGPSEEAKGKIIGAVLNPFFALLFGYIVHSFM